ncbi:PipX family protein [Microcoleus sp. FACHB-831]|uniref:PipX family protein n=1 Tax=Microcoleus sp. FACHB-831 TaxID=2692827 RepID=UPI00281604AA|nr:PipX family protein [Microcoleus sp. FACHB-831]
MKVKTPYTAAIFQNMNSFQFAEEISHSRVDADESKENYLNHPTFGLLYSLCHLEDNQELFTTLYAKRIFFVATSSATKIKLEPINRNDARLLVESRLRHLSRISKSHEYDKLQFVYRQTF